MNKGPEKCAFSACNIAREAVKLALYRRDNRRTCQFRNHRITKEAGISQQRSCDILPDV
jgi:hypothetical protein